MRILSYNVDRELELQLVQSTSEQLTYQRGLLSQSEAIGQGWRSALTILVSLGAFSAAIFIVMWNSRVLNSIPDNPAGINLFLLVWGMGMFGIPLSIIVYNLFKPYFIVWTFDRVERKLKQESINLFKQRWTKIYQFENIQQVDVKQNQDLDSSYNKCCELYITLRSGKQFTMSQSFYTRDCRDRAIALKHHREIAEKMRTLLGHVTAKSEQADLVFIPNLREIEAEQAANWEMLKSLGGTLFSSKAKRQSQIENLQAKLITDRENPQLWETLGFHLAINKQERESIEALFKAEAIYRDRGDEVRANELADKLASFQSKLQSTRISK